MAGALLRWFGVGRLFGTHPLDVRRPIVREPPALEQVRQHVSRPRPISRRGELTTRQCENLGGDSACYAEKRTGCFNDGLWSSMPIRIDEIDIRTKDRLAGVRSLLSVLGDAISEYETRKRAELRKLEQNRAIDIVEYSVRQDILEHEAGFRLPRFAAYAVVTLLHTILEVHLRECAGRAMKSKGLRFAPGDLRGSGIEAYATYLTKSEAFNVGGDKAWPTMKDLRDLRNLIVHGAGTPSKRRTVNRLRHNLKEGFEYSRAKGSWWNEIWVSLELCQHFTDEVEEFAGRCLSAVNAVGLRKKPPKSADANR